LDKRNRERRGESFLQQNRGKKMREKKKRIGMEKGEVLLSF
jgi:hypothetical protein